MEVGLGDSAPDAHNRPILTISTSQMARIRTFVAIEATDEIRAAGQHLIHQFAQRAPGVRWVAPQQIHLTLKFLGDVDEREIYGICSTLERLISRIDHFQVECRDLGAFPSSDRPRTLWMGIRDQTGQLADLQGRIEETLMPLGFPRETRQFHGHLTLGRIRRQPGDTLRTLLASHAVDEFGILPIDEVVIFASELTKEGPHYTPLGRCCLA